MVLSLESLIVCQLFMKEEIYFLLESKRDRVRHVAALTLQRYTRMFFVRKRYTDFRMKIVRLQAHCRGYLVRYRPSFLFLNNCYRTVIFGIIFIFTHTLYRKQYVKMRASLVKFRSLVHVYVDRKRYIKVRATYIFL